MNRHHLIFAHFLPKRILLVALSANDFGYLTERSAKNSGDSDTDDKRD
jgi:hypothetical protein